MTSELRRRLEGLSRRGLVLAGLAVGAILEGITCLMRFGLELESSRDTAFLATLTFGVRIHHGYVGAAVMLVGALLGRHPTLARLLIIAGLGLLVSDLVHHFAVLWPITGSPEFDLVYPTPDGAAG